MPSSLENAFRCDIEEQARQKEAAKFTREDYAAAYQWIATVSGDAELSADDVDDTLSQLRGLMS